MNELLTKFWSFREPIQLRNTLKEVRLLYIFQIYRKIYLKYSFSTKSYICNQFLVQPVVDENPCNPSPCGPNAQCREVNDIGVCACIPGYFGDPYAGCRPECVVNSECDLSKACMQQKCGDPCPGTCGSGAQCNVVNHNPICTCPPGYTGDPFRQCIRPQPSKYTRENTGCRQSWFKKSV